MEIYTQPGVKKIQTIRCRDLERGAMLKSMQGLTIAICAPSAEVRHIGKAELKCEGEIINGKIQQKTTLEFTTTEALPENERLAFVVTQADGRQWLIGTREPRYPKIEYSHTTGEAGGKAAAISYKVTHVGKKSKLRCAL